MGNLSNMDLNLLVAFDALIAERSVTRAAERVSLTQSGMSRALSRLRDTFNDPLFVRTRREMVPTPRAEELAGPIRDTLQAFEALLNQSQGFDAATSERSFSIASDDYGATLLMPHFADIMAESPGLSFQVMPPFPAMFDQLDDGALDLVLLPDSPAHRPSLRVQSLLTEGFSCVLRPGHPALDGEEIPVESYASLQHALVSPGGKLDAPVDAKLRELGLERRVALRMSHFGAAARLVEQSDLVLTLPDRLACIVETGHQLVRVPVPLELENFNLYQVWHSRLDRDPGHRWLRSQIKALASDV